MIILIYSTYISKVEFPFYIQHLHNLKILYKSMTINIFNIYHFQLSYFSNNYNIYDPIISISFYTIHKMRRYYKMNYLFFHLIIFIIFIIFKEHR